MRRVVLCVAAVVVLAMMALGPASGADERTLTGRYHWTDGGAKGDLRAVFTPAGEDMWNVAFHFEFSGRRHVYSGTAEGKLAGGRLEGKVQNEQRNRSFTFTGKFTDGEFRGTHAETTGGREQATGTLTLKG